MFTFYRHRLHFLIVAFGLSSHRRYIFFINMQKIAHEERLLVYREEAERTTHNMGITLEIAESLKARFPSLAAERH